ncbi:MAG: gamma-glutamyl-gamma-aminobutyrate hydrolase family protein [Bacteroidales bacterium]|nr:gamma-glutamyl-gamma-aminobutyrate hydrolase family protein [Bacteroidales bacterium]
MDMIDTTMNRPTVVILPLTDPERESLWMLPGYMEGIRQEGGFPVMLPLITSREEARKAVELCDGILLTGGQDVSPSLYGEQILFPNVEISEERDKGETLLLEEALQRDIPVLGICRGIQFLNAYLGGTLYQDIPSQHPSRVIHNQGKPYDAPSHRVSLCGEGGLKDLLEKEEIMVNSLHHQGIKDLSEKLVPMAISPDGIVEAALMEGKRFVWAVQWHPEFMIPGDEDSRKIFARFVSECGKMTQG